MSSVEEALADIKDGATIMIGGFGRSGAPRNLVECLARKQITNLTLIAVSYTQLVPVTANQVKKVILTAATSPYREGNIPNLLEEGILSGKIELEHVPLGTLCERIRAGGAGIPAFYTPAGIGTVVENGREKRVFDGRENLLERGLHADFAFIRAFKADRKGNLVYRMATRSMNTMMATAATITIAQVQEIVNPGELDPEVVMTSGIYVDRVVQAQHIAAERRALKK